MIASRLLLTVVLVFLVVMAWQPDRGSGASMSTLNTENTECDCDDPNYTFPLSYLGLPNPTLIGEYTTRVFASATGCGFVPDTTIHYRLNGSFQVDSCSIFGGASEFKIPCVLPDTCDNDVDDCGSAGASVGGRYSGGIDADAESITINFRHKANLNAAAEVNCKVQGCEAACAHGGASSGLNLANVASEETPGITMRFTLCRCQSVSLALSARLIEDSPCASRSLTTSVKLYDADDEQVATLSLSLIEHGTDSRLAVLELEPGTYRLQAAFSGEADHGVQALCNPGPIWVKEDCDVDQTAVVRLTLEECE
jgi:hypothetical protein